MGYLVSRFVEGGSRRCLPSGTEFGARVDRTRFGVTSHLDGETFKVMDTLDRVRHIAGGRFWTASSGIVRTMTPA